MTEKHFGKQTVLKALNSTIFLGTIVFFEKLRTYPPLKSLIPATVAIASAAYFTPFECCGMPNSHIYSTLEKVGSDIKAQAEVARMNELMNKMNPKIHRK